MSAIGKATGTKQAKSTDLTAKTDAELQGTLDNLAKYPADKRTGIGGRMIGVLETNIKSELERRKLAKPPETPAIPDATAAASNAQKTARDAAAKQRKRAAAGAAGFVRPMGAAGTQSSGMAVMPVLSNTSLLGG